MQLIRKILGRQFLIIFSVPRIGNLARNSHIDPSRGQNPQLNLMNGFPHGPRHAARTPTANDGSRSVTAAAEPSRKFPPIVQHNLSNRPPNVLPGPTASGAIGMPQAGWGSQWGRGRGRGDFGFVNRERGQGPRGDAGQRHGEGLGGGRGSDAKKENKRLLGFNLTPRQVTKQVSAKPLEVLTDSSTQLRGSGGFLCSHAFPYEQVSG